MKRLWTSLALALGATVTSAQAQNGTTLAEPVASIGRPVVSIGRPVVLNQQPVAPPQFDARLRPVSFNPAPDPRASQYGTAPDPSTVSSMWSYRPLQVEVGPRPQTVAPPLAGPTSGSIGSAPTGPVASGPVVNGSAPTGDDCTCGTDPCCRWRLGPLGCADRWFDCLSLDRIRCALDRCEGDGCADGCCSGDRFWVRGEYLLWWTRGQPTPPLLTTSVIPAAPPTFVIGSLADPNASILVGNTQLGAGARSGGRLQLGYWFCDDHLLGVDASAFFLGDSNGNSTTSSTGNPLLFRPFVDVVNNIQSVQLVAVNGAGVNFLAGTFTAQNSSSFWGADVNLRTNLANGCNFFLDGTLGFRYLSLNDTLNLHESLQVANTFFDGTRGVIVPAGTSFLVNDGFATKNQFYGGQIGLSGEYRLNRWVLGVDAKVALGSTIQTADIIGTTSINGGSPLVGGLLAQNSNIGHFTRDVFTVVPEIGLNVGYQLTPHCRAFVGYNFLWWSSVARAGNQIDFGVNTNKIPPGRPGADTPNRPAFAFNGSDFWAQGLNVGLLLDW
jgi:hypothetical protein